jgi:hypothetical protein
MQHVTRINGSIPTYNDASADHQCLLDRWEVPSSPSLTLFSVLHWMDGLHHQLLHVKNVMVWYSMSDIYKVMMVLILVMVLVLIMCQRLRTQSFVEQFYWNFLIDYCILTSTHCFDLTISNVTSKMSCGFFSDM